MAPPNGWLAAGRILDHCYKNAIQYFSGCGIGLRAHQKITRSNQADMIDDAGKLNGEPATEIRAASAFRNNTTTRLQRILIKSKYARENRRSAVGCIQADWI
ncbi:hypothetical protein V1292_002513 [Bradyrhizobium sp. AZCC 1719]|uniref:hypothetical protein n=1 Tax=Bradyrhizobium sp. AZCC 1719 TaxID=3117028 RepID=UPI002FF2AC8A